jgi:putative NIF3 family GTP cyclohydrolase 1 type 2
MTSARQVADLFETIAPLASGILGDQLGFIYGNPNQAITGVACMWTVSVPSLQAAVQAGLNLVICHEGLWLEPQNSPWYAGPQASGIYSNEARRKLLAQHALVVYRSHSNWDALPVDGVADQAVSVLGIEGLSEVGRQKFFSVQGLPEAHKMTWLLQKAQSGLGFNACRLFGDQDKIIQRFAFLIGGFGENQTHMPQAARDLGAEAIIIGEMSEFILLACLEMGLPVIETLHSASESPAIRRQAQILAIRFPGLPVKFIPSGAAVF